MSTKSVNRLSVLLLICSLVFSYNYVYDYSDFKHSNCTLTSDDTLQTLGQWKAFLKNDHSIASSLRIYGSTYAGQPSQSLYRCWADLSSGRCYYRIVPQLPKGSYTINLNGFIYTDNSQVPVYKLIFTVLNSNNQEKVNKEWVRSADSSIQTLSNTFTLDQTIFNAKVVFCGQVSNPSWLISNVLITSGTVPTCASGLLYDRTKHICPPTAESVQTHCLIAKSYTQGKFICLVCMYGYIKDEYSVCADQVFFCEKYFNTKCAKCITGYFLSNNTCIKQSDQCLKTDQNGYCISCDTRYAAVNFTCQKQNIPINCQQNQYLNAQNQCINGSVQHCRTYSSPSGQCEECDASFKLTNTKKCTEDCPKNNLIARYFFRNNRCLMTDPNCFQPNDDGSCLLCDTGYYKFDKRCYPINGIVNQTNSNTNENQNVETNTINPTIKSDGQYLFIDNSDGSRLYISGPFINLFVWKDERGYDYEKIAEDGRLFLSGPQKGMKAYKDELGNWYAINSKFQKEYFTGPNVVLKTRINEMIVQNNENNQGL